MLARTYSAAVLGVEAFEVEIEVNSAGGLPAIVVVGLPDTAVKESRDRVTTAVQNSGFYWPPGRTTINLAPADTKKEGPSFDLPIAMGMIAAAQNIELSEATGFCIVGELALTGAVRPVRGILAVTLEARRLGKKGVIVPEANACEAALVEGIEVFPVGNLRQAFEFLTGTLTIEPFRQDVRAYFESHRAPDIDFADVKGQHNAKRAIEAAVVGNHNLLMIGPPGSGKSMLSQRIPSIMPTMTLDEAIESTKIHSVCGLLDQGRSFVAIRPFRAPHHTISDVGLLGGSTNPTPGEVSLAHNGVLFLDELPEFKRSTLETMRQPLENGRVTISRAAGTMTFPANFMLVAAMNPCPCGWFGSRTRDCRCSPRQVDQYRQRISGPLLDRIDIHLEVPAVTYADLGSTTVGESSSEIRSRVEAGRAIQAARYRQSPTRTNARMNSREIRTHCAVCGEGKALLKMAMTELHFSARAHDRILKVARTLADLSGSESILPDHVSEAIQYRTLDRNLWS